MKKTILNLFFLFTASLLGAQVITPSGLKTALESASQASIISLDGVSPLSCPEISLTQTWGGGVLIFSDSPESPTTRGMLYKDTTLGATTSGNPNRIFVYHENNNSSSSMKFSVLIKNNGSSSGTLTVVQGGYSGPSTDFPYVGKMAFYRWLTNTGSSGASVGAGQIVRLDTGFDSISAAQGYVMHGIWDYTFTQPHTVMVCALNPADNPITVGPGLSLLARDVHERGTFSYCNKTDDTTSGEVIDTAAGIQQFPIGGNDDSDITGHDNSVSPPTSETDSGNYGVLYRMHLSTSASDGQSLGVVITPRAGNWGGAVYAESGILSGGKFLIPPSTTVFSDESEAAVEGEYNPGSGFTVWLQFMPTAASSFPVRFMTVPY
ncbi:MAG TPA: hypothetical protein VFB72_20415 [Verrucomicrobiae bacterium]|nr:hypothetical protein [Verrucomicrobiae bacterium]